MFAKQETIKAGSSFYVNATDGLPSNLCLIAFKYICVCVCVCVRLASLWKTETSSSGDEKKHTKAPMGG